MNRSYVYLLAITLVFGLAHSALAGGKNVESCTNGKASFPKTKVN